MIERLCYQYIVITVAKHFNLVPMSVALVNFEGVEPKLLNLGFWLFLHLRLRVIFVMLGEVKLLFEMLELPLFQQILCFFFSPSFQQLTLLKRDLFRLVGDLVLNDLDSVKHCHVLWSCQVQLQLTDPPITVELLALKVKFFTNKYLIVKETPRVDLLKDFLLFLDVS